MLLQKICRQLLSSTQHCLVNSKSKHLKEACTGIQCLKKYHSVTTMKPLHNISTSWIRRTVSIVSVRTFHDSATVLRLSERTRYINRSGNVRKKKRRLRSQTGVELRVTAYQTSKEDFDFELLEKSLEMQNLYKITELPPDIVDVVHCSPVYPVEEHQKEIFFTKQGSVVFWDVPERERNEVIQFVKQLDPENAFDDKFIEDESESMVVTFSDKESCILDSNTINMNDAVYTKQQGQLEKYACSNALMQSLHLSAMEKQLEDFIDDTEHLSMDLKAGNRIRIKHREVQQHLGKLFEFRKNLNLCSDLLDTPDFYWDRAELEKLYLDLCKILQTKYRTKEDPIIFLKVRVDLRGVEDVKIACERFSFKVMNEKLNYCCELMELLNNKFTDARHTKLEWMIIVLIMIEVVFEMFHLYRNDYDWFVGNPQDSSEIVDK